MCQILEMFRNNFKMVSVGSFLREVEIIFFGFMVFWGLVGSEYKLVCGVFCKVCQFLFLEKDFILKLCNRSCWKEYDFFFRRLYGLIFFKIIYQRGKQEEYIQEFKGLCGVFKNFQDLEGNVGFEECFKLLNADIVILDILCGLRKFIYVSVVVVRFC